ncbi:HIT domain-containing protein [Candidatus Dependentiae bacterium]|nr:HIT domain-containing protein [Candidatus Dependentiae bacterium]
MNMLYAPWRTNYTETEAKTKKETATENECVFCVQLEENIDEQYYILKRFEHCVAMLNRYPYNAGHLLIMPYAHIGLLEDLPKKTRIELVELVTHSCKIVQNVLDCHGINIGLNIGKAAGPSIPSHLHFHVLPRWQGDTNFMPTIGKTKVVSSDLNKIYEQLKPYFEILSL